MGAPRDEERIYERFQLVVNGPALFNAVVTALELDVFGFLSKNPGAAFDSVRQATGLPAHQLRVLMLALCGTELIAKENDGYVNSAVADTMLAADTPESWRDTLIGWRRFQYPAFPHLTAALRSGTNTALDAYPGTGTTLYDRLAHDPELEAAYHHSIAPFTHLFLTPLLDNPELAEVRHLLDIGGGDGTTAVRFAERYPGTRVTIFDLPSVTRHAEDSLPPETAGRVRLLGGDIFTDDFPDDVDGILFSHVLEPFSAEQNAALVAKAYRALPPGGKVFTYGMTAPDDEDGGLLTSRLSLFLNVLASGQGMAHPAKDYEAWIRQAGCRDVRAYTGMPYEHGLVVGRKEAE